MGDHTHNAAGAATTTFFNITPGAGSLGKGVAAGTEQWDHFRSTAGMAAATNTGGASPDTDISGGSTSGGISANHTHTVSVPALAQQSGGPSVVATNGNLPPYVGLTQIIRAK
jgi:hypothetical protein